MPDGPFIPRSVFEYGGSNFKNKPSTWSYMLARCHIANTLMLNMGSMGARVDIIQKCFDILNDLLRLCWPGHVDIELTIPYLYIRLGQDQKCYDFIKWYATTVRDKEDDRADVTKPFPNLSAGDVLEPVEDIWRNLDRHDLARSVALLLIKVRVLLDLQHFQTAASEFSGKFPQELLSIIRGQLVGPILAVRPELLRQSRDGIAEQIKAMKDQVQCLYKDIDKYNQRFWPSMLDNPKAAFEGRAFVKPGCSQSESNFIILHSYYAWQETPGALDMMAMLRNTMG